MRVIRPSYDIGAGQIANACLAVGAIDGDIDEMCFLRCHCPTSLLQSLAAVWFVTQLTPQPVEIVDHFAEGSKRPGITGAQLPEVVSRTVQLFVG